MATSDSNIGRELRGSRDVVTATTTMGKKSKKSAALSVKDSPNPPNALVPVNGKKQRCVGCSSLLKDIAKVKQCPGCSDLYCIRCEKKEFLQCPNADACPFPLPRCPKCVCGITMTTELVCAGALPADTPCGCWRGDDVKFTSGLLQDNAQQAFESIISQRHDLSMNAFPLIRCGAKECPVGFGCVFCLDPSFDSLKCCSRCDKRRCKVCVDSFRNLDEAETVILSLMMVAAYCISGNAYGVEKFLKREQRYGPDIGWADSMVRCSLCSRSICFECLDILEGCRVVKVLRDMELEKEGGVGARNFLCDPCYWSSKPCTNASCPNEVGVPTRRCGRCRISRYCSVECQAAAYPAHVDRCKEVCARLVASEKYTVDERGNTHRNVSSDEESE